MRYLISNKKSGAVFGFEIVAISIGVISKKVINYPDEVFMKGIQEINFNI